ncbi:uncharacterized protein LOC126630072 [Malus sylvestris]|uniref:uncharacterized protein LOC126630072 n=1 Tax=Malus sylvestris TaxID=3752 RepID=UPI0021ABE725|nr:uncharacterized protein LOC126630072 [Malus sylvestris]
MSSSWRVYKQFEEQHKRLLAQQEELFNVEEGGGGVQAFVTKEDEDDEHKRQRASHSCCVMEVVGQISKPRRAGNFNRKRKIRECNEMLACGASADQVDEITRMGKSTILESLMRFCFTIEAFYTNEYLRKTMLRDLRRLLRKGEIRGFPDMIGSINCMYWTWKNYPSAWQGAYGDRK